MDATDATLIQSNILNGSTGVGFKNSGAGSALATYTRRNPDLTGVTDHRIWVSENLDVWSHQSAATQTPNDPVAEVQNVEVSLNLASPAPPRLFVQVRAGG